MKRFLVSIFAAAAMLLSPGAGPVSADEPADSIQTVIQSQITAFRANDLPGAFAFASPTIQQKFGDAATFGRMVESGYPMVWRPASFRMMQLVETDMGPVQVVMFVDRAGTSHEAGYLMKMIDGEWRINGVHVRRQPGVGT